MFILSPLFCVEKPLLVPAQKPHPSPPQGGDTREAGDIASVIGGIDNLLYPVTVPSLGRARVGLLSRYE